MGVGLRLGWVEAVIVVSEQACMLEFYPQVQFASRPNFFILIVQALRFWV